MKRKVYEYMECWKMVSFGMTVLAGFSGGADSTALLELLWEYGREHGIRVRALHVNHGIRGDEAERDEAFCEEFCRAREIPLTIIRKDVPGLAKQRGIGMEEAGRLVRYAAFEQEIQKGGADRAALAHHRDDQAETMLFHLMRGTGLRGLRGMEPVRLPYIRPFLCVERQEIEAWLREQGIGWVEDSTNQELAYTRNRIRHQIVAGMEAIRPGSVRRMAETAKQLLEVEGYLEEELEKRWEGSVRRREDGLEILLEPFIRMHPAIQKLLVRKCMVQLMGGGRDLEAVHIEQVCALAEGRRGSRLTLPGGYFAVLGYEELLLKKGYGQEKKEEEVYCVPGEEYHYMGAYFCLQVEKCDKIGKIPVNCYTKWFDYDKIKNSLVLRTRRPGDYLELSGGIRKKLKDFFIDCKVPREERSRRILLADGSHILWVTGLRISENYKVTEQTRTILKVQMKENGGTEDGEAPY